MLTRKKSKAELLNEKAKLDKEIQEITNEEIRILQEHKEKETKYKSALAEFTNRAGYLNTNKDALTRICSFIANVGKSNPMTTNYKALEKAYNVEGLGDFLETILKPSEKMPQRKDFDLK